MSKSVPDAKPPRQEYKTHNGWDTEPPEYLYTYLLKIRMDEQ